MEIKIQQLKLRMEKTKKAQKPKSKFNNMNKLNINKSSKNLITNETNKKKNKSLFNKERKINISQNELTLRPLVEEDKESKFNINFINMNLNEIKNQIYIPQESNYMLTIYNYEEAITYEKRNICSIYYIFLISKEVIMHTIYYRSPIEPLTLRLSLLKFIFASDLALNAIFYFDDKITEKYYSNKNIFVLAFTNNIGVILLCSLISYVLLTFFIHFINSTNEIRKLFKDEEEKIKENKKYLISIERKKEIIIEIKKIIKKFKTKAIVFFIVELIIMLFYWYYVTIFCNVYQETQLSWLINSLVTIIVRILEDLFINIVLALLYKSSINCKSGCFFSIIIFFYCYG